MKQKIYILISITWLFCLPMMAQNSYDKMKLESEMLKLISTPERDRFIEVTEQLKAKCQSEGDERLFYITWGNQATYEATHQVR